MILHDGVRVPRWSPELRVSPAVSPSPDIETLCHRLPAGYDAPAVSLSVPQPMLVEGGSFVAVGAAEGLVPGSTYLARDFSWPRLLIDAAGAPLRPLLLDGAVLVAGNAVARNYYHWTFQCLAAACAAPAEARLLVPPLAGWQREGLALCGIAADRIVELAPGAVAAVAAGQHCNLSSGDFAFAPHPDICGDFARIAAALPRSRWTGRRIYIPRTDPARRPLANEPALAALLERRGFASVEPSTLPVAEQATLFRDAALIVAAHGAALANLVWTGRDSPAVVELLQAGYLNRCYARLAQVKGLRYAALVCPDGEGGDWTADLQELAALLDWTGP